MLSDEELLSSQAVYVPQLLNQNDLNDMVRDVGLTKKKSEEPLIFKIKTMEYVADRSQVHLFLFPDMQVFKFFFLYRIMRAIAPTLTAFLKH